MAHTSNPNTQEVDRGTDNKMTKSFFATQKFQGHLGLHEPDKIKLNQPTNQTNKQQKPDKIVTQPLNSWLQTFSFYVDSRQKHLWHISRNDYASEHLFYNHVKAEVFLKPRFNPSPNLFIFSDHSFHLGVNVFHLFL